MLEGADTNLYGALRIFCEGRNPIPPELKKRAGRSEDRMALWSSSSPTFYSTINICELLTAVSKLGSTEDNYLKLPNIITGMEAFEYF